MLFYVRLVMRCVPVPGMVPGTRYLVLHKVCTVDGCCFFCTVLMLVGGGIVGVVIEPVVLGRN